jgi:hypothetical protein
LGNGRGDGGEGTTTKILFPSTVLKDIPVNQVPKIPIRAHPSANSNALCEIFDFHLLTLPEFQKVIPGWFDLFF